MPTYSVSTAFNGIDRVSNAFINMGRSSANFRKKATRNLKAVSKQGSMMGSVLGGSLLAGGISRGLGFLAQGVRAVSTEFIAFDGSITSASAKFKNLSPETLIKLKEEARAVGAVTKFSASEAAQGLDFLAMAGFNAQQSMAVLAPTAELAIVANVDLARSTDIASDSLGAFGLMTSDSTELQKNFIQMNDSMAATMTRSNTGIEDMFESIKKGAPAFTAAGQSMNSFNTLVGVMANSGVKGSESGTALRNVMLRLASPTKESQKIMDKLGVTTRDSKGNFVDIVDVLQDFEKGLKGMGTAQKTSALATVFGARSVTGVNILLQEGTEKLRAFRKGLDESAGSAKNMAGVMQQSLGNKLLSLKSSLLEVGFKFIDAFGDKPSGLIDIIIEKVRSINVKKITDALGNMFSMVKKMWPLIKLLAATFILWKASIIGVQIALKGMAIIGMIGKFLQFVKIIMMITKAKGVWAAAQWALNAAMNANPIGLIVIGIVALIAVIVVVVKYWDQITAAVMRAWEWFDKYRMLIFAIIGPIGLIANMTISLVKGLVKTFLAFKNGGIIEGFKELGRTIFDFLITPLESFLTLLAKIPGIGKVGELGLEGIEGLRGAMGAGEGDADRPANFAPNAAKEEGRRRFMEGEGTLIVKANPGTEIVDIDNGLSGVNVLEGGPN